MQRITHNLSKNLQREYVLDTLNLIHIASEIRAGRSKELVERIEKSLPEYLIQISKFENSSLKKSPFVLTNDLYKSSKRKIPTSLTKMIKKYGTSTIGVLSTGCFKLASTCGGGRWCFTWPTSLRPVNINAPDPYGWKYTIGSNCGTTWRAVGCGEPLTGKLCNG